MQASAIQQKIIDARGSNILVSASAGSGKTSVLVERLCQMVLKDRISVSSILAMTFTEDAAQEMKTRLKKRLEEEDQNDPYIKEQLTLLETASISTIHGFCLDLVQEFYYRLPIPYTMSRTVETGLKNEAALQSALQKAMLSVDPQAYAGLKLYLQAFSKSEEDLQKLILKLLDMAKTKPNPDQWLEQCRHVNPKTEDWFFDWFIFRMEALEEIFEEMANNMHELEFKKQGMQDEWIGIFSHKQQAVHQVLEYARAHEYAKLGNSFISYLETTGKFTPKINKVDFSLQQKASRDMEKEIAAALFTQEEYTAAQQSAAPYLNTLIDLARLTRDEFQKEKLKQQMIDFSDMEQFAFELLSMPDIASQIRERFQVILVDEYQDTNDLQEAIIQMAARKDNVFRVGDPKQSIYGFRQARPALMKDMMSSPGQDLQVMIMNENFRAKSNIIRFANEFFGELMNTPGMESQFSQTDIAHPGTEKQKELPQKPVRFLYTQYKGWQNPALEKNTDVHARSYHRRYRYDLIARDILKRIEEGASFRDIAVLSRASTSHGALQEALEAYGIPVLSKARSGFYTNHAIQIVMAALKALNDPRNDIALMAVLCSPLGRTTQSAVISAAMNRSSTESLYDALINHPLMENFKKLMEYRNLPLGQLVERIYNFNDFYLRSTTSQDKTNLDLFLEKAALASESMDLETFLDQASLEENFNKTSEAMPFGRESDAVKLATIHSSKGLQYKIVYLLSEESNRDMEAGSPVVLDPDLGISMTALSENRHIKSRTSVHLAFEFKRFMEDQNEKMRLLYVAATRAEDQRIFVDALRDASDYAKPMSRQSILANKGFTSWFFHVYQNLRSDLVEFDEVTELSERPSGQNQKSQFYTPPKYKYDPVTIGSQTASAAKTVRQWKPFKPTSSANMDRGTLFHEIAQNVPYPYQESEVRAFALQKGYSMRAEDISQILFLNDNPDYRMLMAMDPVFECPYTVKEEGALYHGYMDMLCQDEDHIHILDFKTDRAFDMDTLKETYRKQLETYQRAMQAIQPDKKIHLWLASFHLKEISEF